MGSLFHFLVVSFRYFATAVLAMSGLLLAIILLDMYILHPNSSAFTISSINPLLVIIGILVVLFFLVKRIEMKIEREKAAAKND